MKKLCVVICVGLLILCSTLQAEEADRPDQPGWVPEFSNCPDTIAIQPTDSISFAFEVINPHSGKNPKNVTFRLMEGVGSIDSISGVWSYSPGPDMRQISGSVKITAIVGNPDLHRSAVCEFFVNLASTNGLPYIVPTGASCSATPPTFNVPPIIQKYCSIFTYDFDACNLAGGPVAFELISGPGTIDSISGVWTWNPSSIDEAAPDIPVVVQARDLTSGLVGPTVTLHVGAINEPPVISNTCPVEGVFTTTGHNRAVRMQGTDDCYTLLWSVADDGDPATTATIDSTGLLLFSSSVPGTFSETVILSDGLLSDSCEVNFTVSDESDYALAIEKTRNTIQGQYEYVDVSLTKAPVTYGLGAFYLLISYDSSMLSLKDVLPGRIYDSCKWEYLNFRIGTDSCSGCPSGMVRILGMPEFTDEPPHPTCAVPNTLPASLVTLKFLVSADRALECQFAPVRFFWMGCYDNSLASSDGRYDFLANRVYDFSYANDSMPIQPPDSFPSYGGLPTKLCQTPAVGTIADVDLYDGGVDFVCSYTIDSTGDLNLNGIAYEVADAVLFSRYFLYGLGVFTINQPGQIATSDVNHDGKTLTVEDYVLLWNVILGLSPIGYVPPSPNQASFFYLPEQKTWSVATPDSLGAVWLILDGQVTPTAIQAAVPEYTYRDGKTYVFMSLIPVAGEDGHNSATPIYPGPLFAVDTQATLLEAYAATIHGAKVNTKIGLAAGENDGTTGPQPDNFALHQNFPNPFNPSTVISFDLPKACDVTLEVFNLLGQAVYSQRIHYAAGTHSVTWNSKDNNGSPVASGIYYYRLTAGDFVTTRKMLLLK